MTVTELAALHQAETADAPLLLKTLCYLVREQKLFACCWLKADYSLLLSKGAGLLLDELKRLLFTTCT